jgi:hypothetical protein
MAKTDKNAEVAEEVIVHQQVGEVPLGGQLSPSISPPINQGEERALAGESTRKVIAAIESELALIKDFSSPPVAGLRSTLIYFKATLLTTLSEIG